MAERMIIYKDERQHMSLSNSVSFSGRDLAISVLLLLLVLGVVGFGLAAFYLGCTGAWSAWWPGFLNLFALIGMYKFIGTSADAKKSKISMVVRMVALIVGLVISGIFLTLGLLNVINLTFALFVAIQTTMSVVSYVLGMYCGNKVKNLYPRFIYASGLVATVTFAFLIAFKVVSLATVAPFVVPSLVFAFLCFVYCVIQRCKGKGGCCCINSVMPEEETEVYNDMAKGKNKNHNLKLEDSLEFKRIDYMAQSSN